MDQLQLVNVTLEGYENKIKIMCQGYADGTFMTGVPIIYFTEQQLNDFNVFLSSNVDELGLVIEKTKNDYVMHFLLYDDTYNIEDSFEIEKVKVNNDYYYCMYNNLELRIV